MKSTELSTREENFSQEYVKCGKVAEAYRKSGKVNENTTANSIYQGGSRMFARVNVKARIATLRQDIAQGLAEKGLYDRELATKLLLGIVYNQTDIRKKDGSITTFKAPSNTDRINALKELNKICYLYEPEEIKQQDKPTINVTLTT